MFKFVTKFRYLLQETWLGLQRGGWMNWAAVSTVTVLLFLFGIGLQTSWQLDSLLNHFGSQVEVSVYLQPDVSGTRILPEIKDIPEVKDAKVVSKEEAWTSLLSEMGVSDLNQATSQLEGNPLVDEIKVSVTTAEVVPEVATAIAQIAGVDEVIYIHEALQRLAQLRKGINWISLSITVILSLTAIAVIMTTLRLIAIARQQEIEIMKLVGATSTWIYLPFLMQGISFGLAGGAIAWILLSSITNSTRHILASQADFWQFLGANLQLNFGQSLLLPIMVLTLGTIVGITGSLFALHRQ